MSDYHVRDIKEMSPKQILGLVSEQIYQNKINVKNKRRKYTTCLVGSPGLGKTQVSEEYPFHDLSVYNTSIVQKTYLPGFEFHYVKPSPINTIEQQSKHQLDTNTSLSDEIKEKILKEILHAPRIGIVVVNQSSIIVPEDISGLPSSESDIHRLETLLRISKESEVFEKYRGEIESKLKNIFDNTFTGAENVGSEARNTSKFDYTEWEKEVHDKAKYYDHVLLILDDVTRAANQNPGILNVIMPIFQESRIGQRELPPNCSVIVTTNEEESDSEKANYVQAFDEAQTDRLRKFKLKFNFNDWMEWAKIHDVHESVIYFLKDNQTLITKHVITARRISEIGQALTNKFGQTGFDFDLSENVDRSNDLMQTLYYHLGDGTNEGYVNVLTSFISFLKNVHGEVSNFLKSLEKEGWTQKNKDTIKKIKKDGDQIKLMIISHKLTEQMSSIVLGEKLEEGVIGIFGEDSEELSLPFNLRMNMYQAATQWSKLQKESNTANFTKTSQKVLDQLDRILKIVTPKIGVARQEINVIGDSFIKEVSNKDKNAGKKV